MSWWWPERHTMADTTAHTLLSNCVDYGTLFLAIVAIPAVIAEGWMAGWLLLRGGARPKREG